MIKFSCLCRHHFDLEDDLAGGLVQCPRCGRLNDVPTLDELKNIGEDGTYRIDVAPLPEETGRFEELHRVYSKNKIDSQGHEIDLRPSMQDIAHVGIDPIPVGPDDLGARPKPAPPKYDPVTGELIRAMDVRDDPTAPINPADIPMARATLAYAPKDLSRHVSAWKPLVALFHPVNLTVMFFVFLGHIFLLFGVFAFALGFLIISFILLALIAGMIAHYANIIEEVGVEERDELPRPLRQVNMSDDIFRPFVRTMIAFAYCFGPPLMALLLLPPATRGIIALASAAFGAIFFPAAVLTTTTSGTLSNLRIDRLIAMIGAIGSRYFLILGLFLSATIFYTWGIVGTALNVVSFLARVDPLLSNGPLAYSALIIGIFLMHAFSWSLGLTYRMHSQSFPWVMQRFVRETPREQIAMHAANQATTAHQRELNKIGRKTARRVI